LTTHVDNFFFLADRDYGGLLKTQTFPFPRTANVTWCRASPLRVRVGSLHPLGLFFFAAPDPGPSVTAVELFFLMRGNPPFSIIRLPVYGPPFFVSRFFSLNVAQLAFPWFDRFLRTAGLFPFCLPKSHPFPNTLWFFPQRFI